MRAALLVGRAREQEDLTRDKSDPKDAVLIGRLVAGLRCYLPERTDQVWARLRQLGGRRSQLIIQVGAARQQLRDLLECAWPAVLEAAAEPLDSLTWRAAVQVALARTALPAALLRWLWAVVTTHTPWQATIAAGQLDPRREVTAPAA
jgi:transposase